MWFAYVWQTIKTNVIGTLNMLGLAKRVKARYDNMLALVEVLVCDEIARYVVMRTVFSQESNTFMY